MKFIPRQLRVRDPPLKDSQKPNKPRTNIPKGATFGPGYVDRAQQRREKEKTVEELKEAELEKLNTQLNDGVITDKEYQERSIQIKNGEYPLQPPVTGPGLVTAEEQKQNVDKEFEQLEAKEIKPEARRQEEKVGKVAPAPVRSTAKNRQEILAELKASRKKVGSWKPVGQPESTNDEKVERVETNQEPHQIWRPAPLSIKVNRKPVQETQRKPKVLGLGVKPREVVTEQRVNDDVFSDVGEYENPFALDSDSSSEDDESNPPPSKRTEIGKPGFKPAANANNREASQPADAPPAPVHGALDTQQRGASRGYFRDNPLASAVYDRRDTAQERSQLQALSATAHAQHARDDARGSTTGTRAFDGGRRASGNDDADAGSRRRLDEFLRRDRRDRDDLDDGADSDDGEQRGGRRKRRRLH